MATHASAEKRNRQRLKRTARNRAAKSELRTALKTARTHLATKPGESADIVKAAQIALDCAASKNVIPAKRASRLKGRLAAALHKSTTAAAAAAE